MEAKQVFISARNVLSLCWHGNSLLDWAAGGYRYDLDGTVHDPHFGFGGYSFDTAVVSPSGRYAAVYKRLDTKGILLKDGKVLREINRSYYHAEVYEYPILLFQLPDGREVIAHCPDEYNVLHIEDIESGRSLTKRDVKKAEDFFHSRIAVSPGGSWMLSAGWIWHPFDSVSLFNLKLALTKPESLNHPQQEKVLGIRWGTDSEISSADFLSDQLIAFSSSKQAESFADDEDSPLIVPGTLSVFDLQSMSLVSRADTQDEIGTMMPIGIDYVVGFYEFPKLVELATGKTVQRWPEIRSGKQQSSIIWHHELPPQIAMDPQNKRFAVAGEEGIWVVML